MFGTAQTNIILKNWKIRQNFRKLIAPRCEKVIRLPDGGFTSLKDIYVCEECMGDGFDIRVAAGIDSSVNKKL